MVDLILRALFESASRDLSEFWVSAQKSMDSNKFPDDSQEHYLKGCLRVWEKVLGRVCDGCLAKDSEAIFYQWLSAYREKLSEASSSDGGLNNPYLKGQVDAFNGYLRSISKVNKEHSPVYRKKLEQIQEKHKELEELQAELEEMMWNFSDSADQEIEPNEMSSM